MSDFWGKDHWASDFWHDGYWPVGIAPPIPEPAPFRRPFCPLTEHANLYRNAINQIQGVHGRSLTYTPPDGPTVQLKAVAIEPLRDTLVRDDDGETAAVSRDILIRRDAAHIRGGIFLVHHGGTFVIDGDTWAVVNIGHESETMIRVTTTRREVLEASRDGYRNSG